MPIRSGKQGKLMRAVAHNADFAKEVGIAQEVAKEFLKRSEEFLEKQDDEVKKLAKTKRK